jgi:hypothetical protein
MRDDNDYNLKVLKMQKITREDIQKMLPSTHMRKGLHSGTVKKVNELLANEDISDTFHEVWVNNANILNGTDNKNSLEQYINAVHFVSLKMTGHSTIAAYSIVFPERMDRHVALGRSEKTISAYVSTFNRSKLVIAIEAQAIIPLYIVNQHVAQKAINKQVQLMATASDTVAQKAADSLLNHLKVPEVVQMQMDVKVEQNVESINIMDQLASTISQLAQQQQMMIECGQRTALDIAEDSIIEGEVVEK